MTNHLILLSLKLGEWYKGNLLQLVGPPEAHAMPIYHVQFLDDPEAQNGPPPQQSRVESYSVVES